jgi:hypothetical protein
MRITAFDFETELIEGLKDKVCTIPPVPRAVCLAIADSEGERFVEHRSGELMGMCLRGRLEAGDILVGQNVAFDIGVSIRMAPELKPLWRDAILAGRVYDTRVLYALRHVPRDTPRTLQQIVREVLHKDLPKGEVRTSFRVGQALTPEQLEYAQKDADVTLEAFEALRLIPIGELTRRRYQHHVAARPQSGLPPSPVDGLTPCDRLFSAAAAMLAVELGPRGVDVDLGALGSVRAEHQERVHRLSAELARAGLASRTRASGPVEGIAAVWVESEAGRAWSYYPAHDVFVRRAGNQKDGYRYEQCPSEGWKLNDAALRAAHQAVADEHRLDIPLSEKTGKISLSYDEWKLHRVFLPEVLQTYLELSKVRKYLSAFLDPLANAPKKEIVAKKRLTMHVGGKLERYPEDVQPDVYESLRVYPSYWIPGAETGRWACSRPNLQQLPKVLRKLYVADPGEVFVYADYSTLELYTLAHAMHSMGICGELMRQLRRGTDIHTATAALVLELPELDVTPEDRQKAKALNFGLPGGLGIKRLHAMGLQQYGLDWTRDEAEALRTRWFHVFSDVALFLTRFRIDPYDLCPPGLDTQEWIFQELDLEEFPTRFELGRILEGGALYTVGLPSGRKLPLRKYTQAANSFFQATGAEVITQAFLNCVARDLDVRAVVHDSITVATPVDSSYKEVGLKLTCAMKEAQKTVCPSVPAPLPEYEVGPTLM